MPRSGRPTRTVTRSAPVASRSVARIAQRRAVSSAVGLIGGIYHAATEAGEGCNAERRGHLASAPELIFLVFERLGLFIGEKPFLLELIQLLAELLVREGPVLLLRVNDAG